MSTNQRRTFIKNAIVGSIAGVFASQAQAQIATPTQPEGPFYPITPQKDKDADLTRVAGKTGIAKGEIIDIFGQVMDQAGNPIENATIDLWQANSYGKYHHPHDNSEAPFDEHFQAWAILQSGDRGEFKFRTVMPGAYPLGAKDQRTPHIHLKIGKHGYVPLLTQMYFPDHPLNSKDGLYTRHSRQERSMLTTQRTAQKEVYRYDIVLEKY